MPAVLVEMGYLTNPEQEKQLAGDEFQNALVQALVDGIVRFRDARRGRERRPEAALMHRRGLLTRSAPSCVAAVAVRLAAVRRPAAMPVSAARRRAGRAPCRRRPPASQAARKIKATLFYVGDDGMTLVGVEREVAYGEPVAEQARAIIDAQIAPVPRRWCRRCRRAPGCATCSSPSAATPSSI